MMPLDRHAWAALLLLLGPSVVATAGSGDSENPLRDVRKTVLRAEPGRHFGRAAAQVMPDGTWVLAYREAEHHAHNKDGRLHLMFSTDRGRTWSEPNRTSAGKPVERFPAAPPGAEPGQPTGPGEPWLYLAPDGTLILHSWKVKYGNRSANGGTWQIRSTDGGRSWSEWRQVDFRGVERDRHVFATDDHFVHDGAIYAGARQFSEGRWKNMLVRSSDAGQTWHKVGDISSYEDHTSEVGIEYLGDGRIVAVLNSKQRMHTHHTFSDDMGRTWQPLEDMEDRVRIWDRPRIWTLKHLRGEPAWWNGRTLIGVGDEAVKRGQSMPRRNSLWISRNGGERWSGPFPFDEQTQDAGYGDMVYDPEAETYHFFCYHGRMKEAALVQYRFKLAE